MVKAAWAVVMASEERVRFFLGCSDVFQQVGMVSSHYMMMMMMMEMVME